MFSLFKSPSGLNTIDHRGYKELGWRNAALGIPSLLILEVFVVNFLGKICE